MILSLTVYSLAIWRITYALTEEDGPGDLIKKFRKFIDSDYSPLNCFFCTSLWVSFFVCLIAGLSIFHIFALSAVAIMIQRIADRFL